MPRDAPDGSAAATASPHRTLPRIRVLLVCLSLVAILPTLGFSGLLVWRQAEAARAGTEAALRDAAKALRAALDRDFDAAITALETLRHTEALRRGDMAAFRAVAQRVKDEHAHWVGIVLTAPDGQQVMNLAARPGQPLPNIAHYEVIQAVLRDRRPAVSELLFGLVGRVPLVGIDVPVFDDAGGLRHVLGLSIAAVHFRDLAAAQALPPGWRAGFIDSKGLVVARATGHEEVVGMRATLPLPVADGLTEHRTRSGEAAVIATARSPLAGWTAFVAAPAEALEAPLRRALGPLLAGGAAMLGLGTLAAWLVGRRIAAPIGRLAGTADAYVRGAVPEGGPEGAPEGVPAGSAGTREVAALEAALRRAGQERRAAEAALANAQKLEALGQLTGGIAHDFNNLLQVIVSGLTLSERASTPAQRAEIGRVMRQAAERGAQLTRQLLAFARRQPLQPERLELPALLSGMQHLLRSSLRGDIRLELGPDEDLWPVFADRTQLESALLNLAVNARDAMPEGGTISISARNLNLQGAAEAEGLAGDFVALGVADTGQGMAPEVLARVFEPFFTTKEPGRGTGLGLSQVYGFARQIGGTVRIRSAPGAGTTVEMLLPRATGEGAVPELGAAGQPAPPGQTESRPLAVLVVEDDAEVAALAVDLFRQLGHEAFRVATAEAALGALADGRRVDLLFTDVMMPGRMDGLSLAVEARRRRPGLAVVVASGYPGAPERLAGSALVLLRKPYSVDDVAAAIRAARDAGPARTAREALERAMGP